MKLKTFSLLTVLACVAAFDASAAGRSNMYSNINMKNAEGSTIQINRGYSETNYDTDYGYVKRTSGNTVHAAPVASRSGAYDNIETSHRYQRAEQPARETKRTYTEGKTYRKTAMRKYFIANPFYQPLKGQFGSVTTGEYMEGKYKFADVNRKLTELSIKEDISYGLTDRIALQGMAQYNSDKLIWENSTGGKDEYKNHDLNLYGLGIQGRIVDTNDWIATLSGYYEHQKHGVDYFIADIKAGYKVASTTIYGLARGWAIDMDGDVYGDYIENNLNEWALLVYGDSTDTLFMGELGAGVWSVLAQDWTLNVEGLYGFYDWHNQLSIKGAFGWQPNDYFALNLYAKTSLYDTANDKHLDLHWGNMPITGTEYAANVANVELSKYKEWSVGLQVMFQF